MLKETILITGATGSLGIAVVHTLHEKGYRICATAGPGEATESLAPMAADVRVIDLTDEQITMDYIRTLTQQYADLRAAVLLVGGFTMGSILDTDGAKIDRQISLNFKTAYHVVRPLLAHFEQHGGGQFILVSARPALVPDAGKGMIAYALSKSLVLHLAKLINAHGRKKGVRATVLVPGTIDTEANRKSMPDADHSTWVKPADIAETIAFVLSGAGGILRDTVLKVYGDT